MSSYVKATNFATKDTLTSGDSNKIVKGTEIDNEFNAIAGAVSSKADIASPTFTGTPAAPTATAGSNTTQLATTAHVFAERTNTATLTNKTLTSPTINTPTISTPAITGGTITGITDLTVADGGTGSSTLVANAVLLGNGTSALQTVAPSTTGNLLTSNGTTWTSAAPTVVSGLGLNGEVWNNVTGSRSASTTYTNSNAYPIMVNIWGINAGSVILTIGGVSASQSGINSNVPSVNLTGIVPPGLTYSISACSTITLWSELY
jgi:hypothetical protein